MDELWTYRRSSTIIMHDNRPKNCIPTINIDNNRQLNNVCIISSDSLILFPIWYSNWLDLCRQKPSRYNNGSLCNNYRLPIMVGVCVCIRPKAYRWCAHQIFISSNNKTKKKKPIEYTNFLYSMELSLKTIEIRSHSIWFFHHFNGISMGLSISLLHELHATTKVTITKAIQFCLWSSLHFFFCLMPSKPLKMNSILIIFGESESEYISMFGFRFAHFHR